MIGRILKSFILVVYWLPFRRVVQAIAPGQMYRLCSAMAPVMAVLSKRAEQIRRELFTLRGSRLHIQTRAEQEAVVRAGLFSYLCNEMEMLKFPVLNERNIADFISCRGLDEIDAALARGKGVMLLFAHFGANQMVMPAMGYRGYRMCQLSAPATVWKEKLPNRNFSRIEIHAMEERWRHELSLPVKHVNIFGSLKEAFLCLKRNELLGVAIDGGGGKERVEVHFLGRKALFSTGAIEIARRTGCTVLPTFVVRERSGRNTMIVERPLELIQGADAEETIRLSTQSFVQRLEEYVLEHPSHYVNFLVLRSFMARNGDTPFFLP